MNKTIWLIWLKANDDDDDDNKNNNNIEKYEILALFQVGSFSLNGGLIFEKGNVGYPTDATIVSSCPNEQACESCQPAPEDDDEDPPE
jgi:hypothetical protein